MKTESDVSELSRRIEALLFVAGEPLTFKELCKTTEAEPEDAHRAIRELRDRYVSSALQVMEIAGGFQLSTRTEYAATVGKFLAPHANRLSKPALETVTIIAYRQPCTQAEIEAIRGVASDGVIKTLLEREIIRDAGRRPTPGRPILYATTDMFLHYFGLTDLNDLPVLEEDEEREESAARQAARDQSSAEEALHAAGVEVEN